VRRSVCSSDSTLERAQRATSSLVRTRSATGALHPARLVLLSLLPLVLGQEPDYDSNPFSFALDFYGGNGFEHTIAIVLIVWGLICLFLGVRLFKFTLFFIAWICVGGLTYYLAMLASSGNSRSAFISAMVFGILAGALVVKLFVIGLMVAGAFGAFILWQCLLTLWPHLIPAGAMYTALAIVLIAGAFLAWWFQKWVLLIATPVIGTFIFSQGLSKYLKDPRLQLNVFHTLHGDEWCDTNQCLGLFAGFALVATLGFLVQWYWTSGLRKKSIIAGSPKSDRI
jgi:hypothetical protein